MATCGPLYAVAIGQVASDWLQFFFFTVAPAFFADIIRLSGNTVLSSAIDCPSAGVDLYFFVFSSFWLFCVVVFVLFSILGRGVVVVVCLFALGVLEC